jgi:hypothetical protein
MPLGAGFVPKGVPLDRHDSRACATENPAGSPNARIGSGRSSPGWQAHWSMCLPQFRQITASSLPISIAMALPIRVVV